MKKVQIDPIDAFFVLEASYPHIYSKLRVMWGTYECDEYIKNLVISDRADKRATNGDRRTQQGFKPEIMSAILSIANFSASTANRREPFSTY